MTRFMMIPDQLIQWHDFELMVWRKRLRPYSPVPFRDDTTSTINRLLINRTNGKRNQAQTSEG